MKFLNYFLLTAFVALPAMANSPSEEENVLHALEEIFGDLPEDQQGSDTSDED